MLPLARRSQPTRSAPTVGFSERRPTADPADADAEELEDPLPGGMGTGAGVAGGSTVPASPPRGIGATDVEVPRPAPPGVSDWASPPAPELDDGTVIGKVTRPTPAIVDPVVSVETAPRGDRPFLGVGPWFATVLAIGVVTDLTSPITGAVIDFTSPAIGAVIGGTSPATGVVTWPTSPMTGVVTCPTNPATGVVMDPMTGFGLPVSAADAFPEKRKTAKQTKNPAMSAPGTIDENDIPALPGSIEISVGSII